MLGANALTLALLLVRPARERGMAVGRPLPLRYPSLGTGTGAKTAAARDMTVVRCSANPLQRRRHSDRGSAQTSTAYGAEVSGWAALNKAATLRLGLMLADTLLRAGERAAASQAGATSRSLDS